MGPCTAQLIKILHLQVDLLQGHGERHWSAELAKCLTMIQSSDYSGVERLLAMYGGMGSLNDLVLGDADIDNKLYELRSEAYELAMHIRRVQ